MTDHLIEAHQDGITTLTLNRPEARNAMSPEMMTALADALPRLAADRSVRAVPDFADAPFGVGYVVATWTVDDGEHVR